MIDQVSHNMFEFTFDNGRIAKVVIGREFRVFVDDEEDYFEEVFDNAEDLVDFLQDFKDAECEIDADDDDENDEGILEIKKENYYSLEGEMDF